MFLGLVIPITSEHPLMLRPDLDRAHLSQYAGPEDAALHILVARTIGGTSQRHMAGPTAMDVDQLFSTVPRILRVLAS